MADEALKDENARLRAQLAELSRAREDERTQLEAKMASEKLNTKQQAETVSQRTGELESVKQSLVRLTKQLDEEVSRRDQVQADASMFERRAQEMAAQTGHTAPAARKKDRADDDDAAALRERGAGVSLKLMRVVDQWMRHRDLQQALLRDASINDTAFTTLVQALGDCVSLQTVDLSQNLLTMDSCSDICHLITTSPSLSFLSLAENLLSLRSIGYFMTAVMERQSTKKLMPLDLLDLTGNEGLAAAASAPAPAVVYGQVQAALQAAKVQLPVTGPELVAQVMRALWFFLHDTGHPQVRNASPDEIAFHVLDKVTLRKMENALMKIMLLSVEKEDSNVRPVSANLALMSSLDSEVPEADAPPGSAGGARPGALPGAPLAAPQPGAVMLRELPGSDLDKSAGAKSMARAMEARDPFADVKAAFEPPKEKLKTFNLKQIVTRNGTVLMNMLERLLETTEIDAHDVETEQTLLEFACHTGNMGLAKLCYRRGAKLSAKTRKGDTAFNIVTRNQRYDLMEFLHTYGVKVNSADKGGRTALHCAAHNNDVDGICRLIEWGADVNIRDNAKRTPIHIAAAAGNMKATMLLLEVGADMNAADEKLYTAAAHANLNDHFPLFDRLTYLGGRKHGQISEGLSTSQSQKKVGALVVSAGMLKSSSLGRIGKITVAGMPGPLQPSAVPK